METLLKSNYNRLWDGTEPGWVLLKIHRQTSTVAVLFGELGASPQEIQALRRVVPEFNVLPALQVIQQLRGCQRVDLGELDSREARKLIQGLRECGLRVEERAIERGSYLPFNEIQEKALLIEDDDELRKVTAEALKQGLPVRQVET